MDWNKALVLVVQLVVFITLAVLVALGHNSGVTDGMMALGGSLVGAGVLEKVAKKKVKASGEPTPPPG